MRLSVAAKYEGSDQRALEEAARIAEEGCPVSTALRGNVDITVDARILTDGTVPSDVPTDPTRAA